MEHFVSELSHLYRMAATAPVEAFPDHVVTQLRDWIHFDGAVFGFGESGATSLEIGSSVIYNRDPAILLDYAEVSHTDPTTQRFMRDPGRIMNVDTHATYTGRENRSVAQFSTSHDLRHLLLLGEETCDRCRLRWIVLYRGTKNGFNSYESNRLSAAWGHILCALELNRTRSLDLHALPDQQRALALVSRTGVFEIVDPAFLSILRKEWRDLPATRLPTMVTQAMQNGKPFFTREMEIHFSRKGDYVLCEARKLHASARLSARETQVAQYFSTGHSYKEIAALLGISPNTVRVQLARIYQKLEINDKATLASALVGAPHK